MKFQAGYVFVFGFPSIYGTHIIRRIQQQDNTQETSHYQLGGDQLLPLFQLIVQILIKQAVSEGGNNTADSFWDTFINSFSICLKVWHVI